MRKDKDMKAVVQRVKHASVSIDGTVRGEIDGGLMVLFGAGEGDIVMLVRGSSSRCLPGYKDTPADCTVVAIFDTIDIHGKRIYEKFVKEIDRKEQ